MRYPPPLSVRFWAKVQKGPDCWEWQANCNPCGYGMIRPGHSEEKRLAHRVSWELAFGPIPNSICVLHKCDNTRCVRPDHLFLGTIQDNVNDMRAKGRDNYTGRPSWK